jgi:hypothetical protein
MRDSAASFDDLVLFDAEGNAVFTDDFSAGLDGWTTENESLWYVQEDEGNRYVSGDVLVDVETLLSPEFSPRLDPHFLMLEAAGAKNVRIFFFWDEIQSSGPDDYYWNNMDAMLITARDHGINVLVNIVYAPVWAIAPENRADAAAKAFPPVDVSDYGNFVAESVRRYKPGGVLAQEQGWDDDYGVTDFQIGHEYNAGRLSGYARTLFAGWMGDLDQYVDMLKEGHDAVKDGCPECVVISGPTTELLKPNYDTQLDPTGERQYLWQGVEDLYANIQARHPGDPNAADMYFDVLSLHVYEWFVYSRYGQNPDLFRDYEFPDYRWYQDRVGKVTEVMEEYGDADKDIWITEVTFASADNGDPYRGNLDEAGQAEALDMVYRELSKFDQVKKVFWWYSIDTDTFTGLMRRDMTGKPSYVAFANLSGAIGGEADLDACSLPQVSFVDDEAGTVHIENPASEDANVVVYADGYLCAAYNIEAEGHWRFQSWGNGATVTVVSNSGHELYVEYTK